MSLLGRPRQGAAALCAPKIDEAGGALTDAARTAGAGSTTRRRGPPFSLFLFGCRSQERLRGPCDDACRQKRNKMMEKKALASVGAFFSVAGIGQPPPFLSVFRRGATAAIRASPKSRWAGGTPTSSLRRSSQEAAQRGALPLATPRHGTRHREQPTRNRVVVCRRGTVRGGDERGQEAHDRREHPDNEAGAVRSTSCAHDCVPAMVMVARLSHVGMRQHCVVCPQDRGKDTKKEKARCLGDGFPVAMGNCRRGPGDRAVHGFCCALFVDEPSGGGCDPDQGGRLREDRGATPQKGKSGRQCQHSRPCQEKRKERSASKKRSTKNRSRIDCGI